MTPLILAHLALGAALGRLFKFFVLAPLTAAIAVIVVMEPSFWPHSALPKTVQVLVLVASLQFGYTLPMWPHCLTAMLRRRINFRPEPITGAAADVEKKASGHTNLGGVVTGLPVTSYRTPARATRPRSVKSSPSDGKKVTGVKHQQVWRADKKH